MSAGLLAVVIIIVLTEIRSVGGVVFYTTRFAERRIFFGEQQRVFLLYAITMATPAFLLMLGTWSHRRTRRNALLLFLVWLPLVIPIVGIFGQRWRALAILVAILAVVHIRHRRVPFPVLAAVLAVFAVLFVTVNLYRNTVGTRAAPKELSGRLFYDNYLAGPELAQFRQFLNTFEGVPSRVPFQHGRTFASLIPGTGFPTGGYIYSSTFEAETYARGTSIPPSLPGELFMNFGLAGIVLGLTIFGFLLGALERYFRRNRASVGTVVLYAYLIVPAGGLLRGDFRTFGGWTLLVLIAYAIALRFVEATTTDSRASEAFSVTSPVRRVMLR